LPLPLTGTVQCPPVRSEFNEMDKRLTEDVGCALKFSNNGKAPGVDGILYEFYKILDILHRQSKGTDHKMFDVIGFLTMLYEDIEKHAIVKGSNFNIGCLYSSGQSKTTNLINHLSHPIPIGIERKR
jgi:hypothetical protein